MGTGEVVQMPDDFTAVVPELLLIATGQEAERRNCGSCLIADDVSRARNCLLMLLLALSQGIS